MTHQNVSAESLLILMQTHLDSQETWWTTPATPSASVTAACTVADKCLEKLLAKLELPLRIWPVTDATNGQLFITIIQKYRPKVYMRFARAQTLDSIIFRLKQPPDVTILRAFF